MLWHVREPLRHHSGCSDALSDHFLARLPGRDSLSEAAQHMIVPLYHTVLPWASCGNTSKKQQTFAGCLFGD